MFLGRPNLGALLLPPLLVEVSVMRGELRVLLSDPPQSGRPAPRFGFGGFRELWSVILQFPPLVVALGDGVLNVSLLIDVVGAG